MDQYVSLFRINGNPILPPLMTAEKYKECRKYKLEAIAIEKKRKINLVFGFCGSNTIDLSDQDSSDKASYIENEKTRGNLRKSDTLIYDVLSNTVMIPTEISSSCKSEHKIRTRENTFLLPHVENEKKCNWNQIPSIVVNSPKKCPQELRDIDLDRQISLEKSDAISTISPSENAAPLIRSNSFTLEAPSQALVNQLFKEESVLENYIIVKEQSEIKNKCKKTNTQNYLLETVRRKKSPYDSKMIVKSKNLKKHKNVILKPKISIERKISKDFPCNQTNDLKSQYIRKLLDQFEEDRKLKLNELFEKQKNEQKKVEEIFVNQEKILLELFKNFINIKDSNRE